MMEKDKTIFESGYKKVQDHINKNTHIESTILLKKEKNIIVEDIIKGKIKKITQKCLEF